MRIIRLTDLEQFAAIKLDSDPGAVGGKVKIPQAAQVTVKISLANGNTGNLVLYGRYVGGFTTTPAQVQTAYNTLIGHAATTALLAHIAPACNIYGLTVRDVNSIDQPILSGSGNKPGTSTGSALPSETSLVVSERTAKAGKSGRGRFYFPGWATTALGTGDLVASAAVTALTNWAQQAIPAMMANLVYTHVLGLKDRAAYISPITGTSHPARPATTLDITSYQVDNHWDSQRRRGFK